MLKPKENLFTNHTHFSINFSNGDKDVIIGGANIVEFSQVHIGYFKIVIAVTEENGGEVFSLNSRGKEFVVLDTVIFNRNRNTEYATLLPELLTVSDASIDFINLLPGATRLYLTLYAIASDKQENKQTNNNG